MRYFLKKYLKHFSFFYLYLRNRVFIALCINILVGLTDGIGLAMFMPLIEISSGLSKGNLENMGQLSHIVSGLEFLGLQLKLGSILLFIVLIFLLKALLRYAAERYRVQLRTLFFRKLRFGMVDGLTQLRYQVFSVSDAGRIQNTMSGEVNRVVVSFAQYFSFLQSLSILLVYMGLAFLSNAAFALLILLAGLLSGVLYAVLFRITKKLSAEITRKGHRFQAFIIQSVQNFKYLKATNLMRSYSGRFKKLVYEMEADNRRIGMMQAIQLSGREFLVIGIVCLVIYIHVFFFEGELGSMLLALLFFYKALGTLMSVQSSWNAFLENSGAINNARKFLSSLRAGQEKRGVIPFTTMEEGLHIRKLNFTYEEQQEVILHDIDLDIKRNHTLALVGESGSGKTSLINLICGLLDDYEGEIYLDSTSYRDIDLQTFQNGIGYITQEPVIFSDSIFNNITFWAEKTEENIQHFYEVLQRASLSDFVEQLSGGMETHLGDRGILISGGQKQRISIARELYKNPQVLIMDEATSSLDSETELAIQERLENLRGAYTIIMVAHRLSTVRKADQIVVLHKGRIEAKGTFDELLKTSSRFKRMVELQEF